MPVARELSIVEAEDLRVHAEARIVARLVGQVIAAAGALDPPLGEHMRACAETLTAAVVESMRAVDDSVGLRRLRQAGFLVDEIRHATWVFLDQGFLATALFDEVMITTGRCRREVDATYARARRKAYRRLAGLEL